MATANHQAEAAKVQQSLYNQPTIPADFQIYAVVRPKQGAELHVKEDLKPHTLRS